MMKQSQRVQYWLRCSAHINFVEKTSGKKLINFTRDNNVSDTTQAIDLIVQSYLDHFSINGIKTTSKNQIPLITPSSNTCGTNPEEIFELLSTLDIKKLLVLIWFWFRVYQKAFFQTMLKSQWFRHSTFEFLTS